MKKKRKKNQVKVRRAWKIHPATRIEKDRKKYNRQRSKTDLKRELL